MSELLNEAFYDQEIAPVLLELTKKCQARQMSFTAQVEYGHGDTGETAYLAPDASFKARLVHTAMGCHGNLDSLVMWAAGYGAKHGHTSVVLRVLEQPER